MTSEWYCQIDGRTTGTFTVEELLDMAASGRLKATDRVRRGRTGDWIDAHRLPGMNFPAASPSAVQRDAPPPRRRDPLGLDIPGVSPSAAQDLDEDDVIDILARGF